MIKLALIFLLSFCITNAETTKPLPLVAVSNLEGVGVDTVLVRMSTDRLRSELIKTGNFRVLERNQMDAILAEQAFQQSGCIAEECVVQMGQLLGADFIISGTVGRAQDIVSFSLKFTSVESGEILHSVDQTCTFSASEILDGAVPSLATKLSKVFFGRGSLSDDASSSELYVESQPSGAQVWLDNELQNGVTPLSISRLKHGPHELRVRSGGLGASQVVNLDPNGLLKVRLELNDLTGSLRVKSEPQGCPIYLNGKYFEAKTPYLYKAIPLGTYDVKIGCPGWLPAQRRVNVVFEEQAEVSVSLDPAAIVHVKSKRKPYQILFDSTNMGTFSKDTSFNFALGIHSVLVQALPADGLKFESETFTRNLEAKQEYIFSYAGMLDSTIAAERRLKRKWVFRSLGAAMLLGGIAGMVVNQREHDRLYKLYNRSQSQDQFDHIWEETEKSRSRRNASAAMAGLGAICFGVSYAF